MMGLLKMHFQISAFIMFGVDGMGETLKPGDMMQSASSYHPFLVSAILLLSANVPPSL